MKQYEESNQKRSGAGRTKRSKPQRPGASISPAEGGRRSPRVYNGREFVYASRENSAAAASARRPQTRDFRAKPKHTHLGLGSPAGHHRLGKVALNPRRQRNVKVRNRWILAAKVAVAIVFAYGIFFCLTDSRFNISSVSVSGVPTQDSAPLESAVFGESLGHNIFSYWLGNHERIASEIGSNDPDFGRVSIGFHLPSTLTVNVIERDPSMLMAFGPSGIMGAWMLDSAGLPIRNQFSPRWNERPATMMKVIVDPKRVPLTDLSSIKAGDPLPASVQTIFDEASSVQNALKISPLSSQVRSIRVDKSGYLGLNMDSQLLIKLGDTGSLDKKLALASALESQRSDLVASARYIDVTDPNWPAIMPINVPQQSKVAQAKAIGGLITEPAAGAVP